MKEECLTLKAMDECKCEWCIQNRKYRDMILGWEVKRIAREIYQMSIKK